MLVVDIVKSLLPPNIKISDSGWTSFCAPCCHHRGHSADTRRRGGILFSSGIAYNCFNCKFTAGWQPGSLLGEKMKCLVRWMNASDDIVAQLSFQAMKTLSDPLSERDHYVPVQDFPTRALPLDAAPLKQWVHDAHGDTVISNQLASVIEYLLNRGYTHPLNHDFYWSPSKGYFDRVIIPFRWKGRIVGNTARSIWDKSPKYITDKAAGFLFNWDNCADNSTVLVTEGPFDALACRGVALLTNIINDQQARTIESAAARVIVIPDQDPSGLELFNQAAARGWSVACPNWDSNVKDVAQAAALYGSLYVVVDAIQTAVDDSIKIAVARHNFVQKLTINKRSHYG